jgi:prepilin-type N-terminal cleavage/methylation domain-containing protein
MHGSQVKMNLSQLKATASRHEAGFSMPELMVILVVVGILLAIGTPNFLSIGRRDSVESAAYDMQRTLALTRQKALAKRMQYRVTVNPIGKTYLIERREGGVWVPDNADTLSFSDRVNLVMSAGGSTSNHDVVIEPQGTVSNSDAPAVFTFSNTHGDTARVRMVRTGRLRLRTGQAVSGP